MSDDQLQQGHSLDKTPSEEQDMASAQSSPGSVESVAPEVPQAAGANAGEQNALLHGNVSGSRQEGAAEKASNLEKEMPGGTAGYHSTGSNAGAANGKD